MRWLVLALLLSGCGDTVFRPCDPAALPLPPVEEAVRSMQEDKLLWTWTVEDDDVCLTMSEVWIWNGCTWEFDKLLKTKHPCEDD